MMPAALRILVLGAALAVSFSENACEQFSDNPAVARLRDYIQIDTSNKENIENAVAFWKEQADEIGLPMEVYRPAGKPVVVISWQGLDPSLPSIMLNSHMDVVSAEESEWTYPPFSAHVDMNGNMYGRGLQDTKDVAIQYLEAIRQLRKDNVTLLRTLHITLMPDEEVGGYDGMKSFIHTDDFKLLNIGFALDEGLSSENDTLLAFYVDRRPWQMVFTFYGEGGHGFTMPENAAVEKANRFISRVLEFRRQNLKIKKSSHSLDFGKYTSVNVNLVHAGDAVNVIPSNITVGVDMRLSRDSNVTEIYEMIKEWIDEAGNDTDLYYIRREDVSEQTPVDNSNFYWLAMKDAVNEMGYDIVSLVCPATSDMLQVRNIGIPALGFAPKLHTTSRIHGKNEYLNLETFIHGIEFYYEILKRIGNVPDHEHSEMDLINSNNLQDLDL